MVYMALFYPIGDDVPIYNKIWTFCQIELRNQRQFFTLGKPKPKLLEKSLFKLQQFKVEV